MIIVLRTAAPGGAAFSYGGKLAFSPRKRRKKTVEAGKEKLLAVFGHSMKRNALFVNPGKSDYSVRSSSPALKLGFRNFPMNRFHVRSAHLKALARTPDIPGTAGNSREKGDAVPAAVQVRKDGSCSSAGIQPNDVLLKVNGNKASGVKSVERLLPPSGKLDVTIRRNQENKNLSMQL